jgi:malate dehydrogenase
MRDEILTELRGASMEVIKGKGGTVFGPALHIVHLIRMVVEDARGLVTISCVLEGEYGIRGCSLGVPARIGRGGIHAIEEWRLDSWEQAHMDEAGRSVSELCRKAVS